MTPEGTSDVIDARLREYRASIDNIDAALVHLLAERFKVTQAVGLYKADVGLPASDPERESRQVARLRALALESGLDPVFSEKFLRFIVDEVIRHHRQMADPGNSHGAQPPVNPGGTAGDEGGAEPSVR